MTAGVCTGPDPKSCPASNASVPLPEGPADLPVLTLSGKIRVSLTFFLFLVSTAFNVSFLLKLGKGGQRQERGKKKRLPRMKVLLKHLAVANLLETLIVMPLDGVWNVTVQWYAGGLLCKALSYLKLFSMYAPAFMMAAISLDRCLALTRPLAVKSLTQLGRGLIGLAWLLSGAFAGPQLYIFRVVYITDSSGKMDTFSQCVTHSSFPEWWQEAFYNLFTFHCLFIAPLFITLVCNARIIFAMTRGLRQDPQSLELNRSNNNIPRARLKTLKMTVAFAVLFTVCWTPYYILGIWYWFEPEMLNRVPDPVSHFFFLFGLLNPCLDPLIYGYFSL